MRKTLVASAIACMASGLAGQAGTPFGPQHVITTAVNSSGNEIDGLACDVDGDGDVDVLSASRLDNKVALYLNSGSGTFGPQIVLSSSCSNAWHVLAEDLDGDGDVDVVGSGTIAQLFVNAGNGQFAFPLGLANNIHYAMASADLDGDGDVDLVGRTNDAVVYYENLGSMFFAPSVAIGTHGTSYGGDVKIADMDGDSDMDIVSGGGGDVRVFWNQGGMNFSAPSVVSSVSNCHSVCVSDFDMDGVVDVAFSGLYDDSVSWCRNLGGGAFGARTIIGSVDCAREVSASDLDGDGAVDLLCVGPCQNECFFWLNSGMGAFGAAIPITVAHVGPRSIKASDFNGDGKADVLISSSGDNTIAWFENTLTSLVTSSATQFGAGCGTPPMVFTPTSTAITGQSITGEVTSTPTPFCFVSFGSSNTTMPGIGSLPLDLTIAGMTGCTLYHSADVFGLPTVGAGVAFQMNFSMGVPSDPLLLGLHFYFQAFSFAPGANPLEVISSNGIDFLIGNQ